jgi:hypothetical protein
MACAAEQETDLIIMWREAAKAQARTSAREAV